MAYSRQERQRAHNLRRLIRAAVAAELNSVTRVQIAPQERVQQRAMSSGRSDPGTITMPRSAAPPVNVGANIRASGLR